MRMRIEVDLPLIVDDTVVFAWQMDGSNEFQRNSNFFLRYEALDLSSFSRELFYEMFLALQLRFFRHLDDQVDLIFPSPVPSASVSFWRDYYKSDNVSVSPVTECESFSPWSGDQQAARAFRDGIFFGGGKDSTLTANLLGELHGSDQVLLMNIVQPYSPAETSMTRQESRQRDLMLKPAKRLSGFATARIWTDFQANIPHPTRKIEQPHFEFFVICGLPLLLSHRIETATFCIPRTAYYIRPERTDPGRFHYASSRPEMLIPMSRHLQSELGINLTILNLNMMFGVLTDFRLLQQRYPDAFREIVMCTQGDEGERWCYNCKKCAEYAIYALFCGIVDERFDYDRFFSASKYMQAVINQSNSQPTRNKWGNAEWLPYYSTDNHYETFCHAIHHFDAALLEGRITAKSMQNALLLKEMFGNRSYPGVEMTPQRSIERIGHPLATQVIKLVEGAVEIVDELPERAIVRGREVDYDFTTVMPTRFAKAEDPC